MDALVRHGLLEWDAAAVGGAARAGARCGTRARGQDRRELAALAEPAMRRLADESGETVNLMVRSARGAEAIAQVDGPHVLGVSNWIGREVPDHCSAAGKVFLAFGASALPPGPLERRAARTIVDHAALERELEAVRAHGYATIVDELEVGLAAVAAPIRDAAARSSPRCRSPGRPPGSPTTGSALLGRVAIEQAHTVSTQLGFRARSRTCSTASAPAGVARSRCSERAALRFAFLGVVVVGGFGPPVRETERRGRRCRIVCSTRSAARGRDAVALGRSGARRPGARWTPASLHTCAVKADGTPVCWGSGRRRAEHESRAGSAPSPR